MALSRAMKLMGKLLFFMNGNVLKPAFLRPKGRSRSTRSVSNRFGQRDGRTGRRLGFRRRSLDRAALLPGVQHASQPAEQAQGECNERHDVKGCDRTSVLPPLVPAV